MEDLVEWPGSFTLDAGFPQQCDSHDDSDSDEISSEIEFQLYSQVHYSSDVSDLLAQTANNAEESNDASFETIDENPESQTGAAPGSRKQNLWVKMTGIDVFKDWKSTPSTLNDTGDKASTTSKLLLMTEEVDAHTDKIASTSKKKGTEKLDRDDLDKLKRYLSESSGGESDFVPESWEIVDSVESGDSVDNRVDIHVSHEKEQEEDAPLWIPGQGDKSMWKIDDRDRRLVFPGERSRYYADQHGSRARCRNCNENGHKANQCPEPKKQQTCFQCGNRGHVGRSCPENEHLVTRGRGKECNRCGQADHIQSDCPDLWRQFHITIEKGPLVIPRIPVELNDNVQCFICSTKGHYGYECENGPWSYFSVLAPLVSRYDRHIVAGGNKDLRAKLKSNAKDTKKEPTKRRYEEKGFKEAEHHPNKKAKKVTDFLQSAARAVGAKFAKAIGKKTTNKNDSGHETGHAASTNNPDRGRKRKHFERNWKDQDAPAKKRKTKGPAHKFHNEQSNHFEKQRHVSFIPHEEANHRQDHQRSRNDAGRKVVFQRTDWDNEESFPRTPKAGSAYSTQRDVRFGNKERPKKKQYRSKNDNNERDRGFRKRFGWKK